LLYVIFVFFVTDQPHYFRRWLGRGPKWNRILDWSELMGPALGKCSKLSLL